MYRNEYDTMGEVHVPAEKYWGAQTQRSLENFPIGNIKMPKEIIEAFFDPRVEEAESRKNLLKGLHAFFDNSKNEEEKDG